MNKEQFINRLKYGKDVVEGSILFNDNIVDNSFWDDGTIPASAQWQIIAFLNAFPCNRRCCGGDCNRLKRLG